VKVALVNLGMWVRDQYFPACYAHTTWSRLRPFNDRQLNRDLADLCAQVAQRSPQLPDGRRLVLLIAPQPRPFLDMHRRC